MVRVVRVGHRLVERGIGLRPADLHDPLERVIVVIDRERPVRDRVQIRIGRIGAGDRHLERRAGVSVVTRPDVS